MIIKQNSDGSYSASGHCDGFPYAAEGATRSEAMHAGLLLVQRRSLQQCLDTLKSWKFKKLPLPRKYRAEGPGGIREPLDRFPAHWKKRPGGET